MEMFVEFVTSMLCLALPVDMVDLDGREDPDVKAAAAGAAANGKEQNCSMRQVSCTKA